MTNKIKNILIIEEDLRLSGTSQGIISRSFIGFLKKYFPMTSIDLMYIHPHDSKEDQLDLLPDNVIVDLKYSLKPSQLVKWLNRITVIFFGFLFYENWISSFFKKSYNKVDPALYDAIFVRSTGFNCHSILSLSEHFLLSNSIIFFNEPYPVSWSPREKRIFHKTDFLRLTKMQKVTMGAMS